MRYELVIVGSDGLDCVWADIYGCFGVQVGVQRESAKNFTGFMTKEDKIEADATRKKI